MQEKNNTKVTVVLLCPQRTRWLFFFFLIKHLLKYSYTKVLHPPKRIACGLSVDVSPWPQLFSEWDGQGQRRAKASFPEQGAQD